MDLRSSTQPLTAGKVAKFNAGLWTVIRRLQEFRACESIVYFEPPPFTGSFTHNSGSGLQISFLPHNPQLTLISSRHCNSRRALFGMPKMKFEDLTPDFHRKSSCRIG
jgi:hypothetical protein